MINFRPSDFFRPISVPNVRPLFQGASAQPAQSIDTFQSVRFAGIDKAQAVEQPLISFDKKDKTFKLAGKNMEYFLNVTPDGDLVNLYWGKPVGKVHADLLTENTRPTLESQAREYPGTVRGDNRTPAIKVSTPKGHLTGDFKYVGYRILSGKPELKGLPSTYALNPSQAQTLVVKLRDDATQLELNLNYTVFKDSDVVVRSAKVTNRGNEPVSIDKLASISTDFQPDDYKLLKYTGGWGREMQEQIVDLQPGSLLRVASQTGRTGHEQNPFMALMEKNTTDDTGNAYGFSLVYSGSFVAEAEQNAKRKPRISMGLNPEVFRWKLAPGESFQTPEAIGVFSSEGLNGLTKQLHTTFNNHLLRGPWKDKPRPVLLNTWEGVYFDFDHEKVVNIAKEAKKLGVELLVLDDGWFGTRYPRNDDHAGLGDWVENPAKLPKGLGGLAADVNKEGLMFGIWVEPEMVNPKSELYEKHPDWVIHQPDRERTEMRNQLMLDLGRKEVQDYIINSMSRMLDSGNIQYVKWDMNRVITESGSAGLPPDQQMETQHRYMLGLYRVLDTLTKKYPDVLWEGCASGGGRFDPGILPYFPQNWTSDNTDALSRLDIQSGTARLFPPKTMGAHVSAVPNHQNGRSASLKSRFHVAMSANFGLELDPSKMTESEKEFTREQIAYYKQVRHIVQDGDYHLLRTAANNNHPAWMFTSADGNEALVFAFQKQVEIRMPVPRVKLKGLDEQAMYRVDGIKQPLSGSYLMNVGLSPKFKEDMDSNMFYLKKVSDSKDGQAA